VGGRGPADLPSTPEKELTPLLMPGLNRDPSLGLGHTTTPTDKGGAGPGLLVYLE
jgi:hypothetical protein